MPPKKKAKGKNPEPKPYQKKLSLYPMSFEQVVDAVLRYKPKKK
jgi:hypothetical protein